jgi:hypothetical protein
MTTKRSAMPDSVRRYRSDEGFAMAVVISVILIMFIMLAAVTLPLTADVRSSIRLGKVADERQLAESVMNELFSQAAKSSDLNLGFRMIGRVDPSPPTPAQPRSVDDAGDTAGWAKYVPGTGSFVACGSITELCFYYSPQVTSGSPFVTVEVTTRSACRANRTSCVFRRFQQTWRRRGFVDYVIFTDMETLQPELYGTGANVLIVRRGSNAAVTVDTDWAKAHCGNRLTDDGSGPPYNWSTPLGPIPKRDGFDDNSRRQSSSAATNPAERYLWPHRTGNDPLSTTFDEAPADQFFQPSNRRHENCFDIAYTGATGDLDKITGPIHTNDYWFWYCGTPQFSNKVEATGDPSAVGPTTLTDIFKRSKMSGCTASGTPEVTPGVQLTNFSKGPFLKLPDKLDIYAKLASDTFTPTNSQPKVKILMEAGRTMRVSTDGSPASSKAAQPVPPRGVVRVTSSGDSANPYVLEIEGQGSDATFVSEDDLTVTGDISSPGTTGVTLGFVAGGSITINQTPRVTAAAVRVMNRYVTGAFLSLKGMSVQDWNLASDATVSHPTLHLTGAIIAKYRPVFGTYDSTGQLQSGMRKDISYPTDSKSAQIPPTPPYFVQPVNAVWVRLDFSETPLLAATPGLTKAPTSPPVPTTGPCPPSVTWPTGEANAYVPSCLLNTP